MLAGRFGAAAAHRQRRWEAVEALEERLKVGASSMHVPAVSNAVKIVKLIQKFLSDN